MVQYLTGLMQQNTSASKRCMASYHIQKERNKPVTLAGKISSNTTREGAIFNLFRPALYPTVRAKRFIDLSKINTLLIFLSKLL